MLVKEVKMQAWKMDGNKPTKVRILEDHKEDVDVEIKEEEVVAILNVIIVANLVIWQVNAEQKQETLLLVSHSGEIGDVWYIDSGASKHMTSNKNLFSKFFESNCGEVKVGDGKAYKVSGVGELEFKPKQ
ncbi:hypothetical protein GOBAR_AA37916 [Gossypium barbadense]|uniref:Retrovirus-related Pol polyprotein from transposon TNT 1-94-like beta-barrel domain-containing protein n=1 Tax=Gossypium barbadense TaxID=3634 RepID=A0A2P5VVD8_GOSBA|nr:hypothetical protein GOBAR_AA37916 [Gossypium barbadense]